MTSSHGICAVVVLLVVSALFCMSTADAGWVVVDTKGTTTYLSEGMAKSVNASDNVSRWHIINFNEGTITLVDATTKTYATGTPEDFCTATKPAGSALKDALMNRMPPEQKRQMADQMRKSQSAPVTEKKPVVLVKRAGGGEEIASHKTLIYSVIVDGEKFEDIWIARDIPMDTEMKKLRLDRFYMMEKGFRRCMNQAAEKVDTGDPYASQEYREVMAKGWVLKEVRYRKGEGETETATVELERRSIPASEFEMPARYRKVEVGTMMRGMQGFDRGMGMNP